MKRVARKKISFFDSVKGIANQCRFDDQTNAHGSFDLASDMWPNRRATRHIFGWIRRWKRDAGMLAAQDIDNAAWWRSLERSNSADF